MKLSNSAVNKYFECPRKYKYHYIDRLRTNRISSALFFGCAIDEAVNVMLLRKKKKHTKEEKKLFKLNPIEVFNDYMSKFDSNGDKVSIAKSERVDYYKSDCDVTMLTKGDSKNIAEFANTLNYEINDISNFVKECQKEKNINVDAKRIYNYICWLSLYRKGVMMLEQYEKRVLPLIHEVHGIQIKVDLKDSDDSYIGYIDFVASFTDDKQIKYVVDNKTSSRPYSTDSVLESHQLASYCEYMNIYKAAYIVVEKKIRKRKPRVRISIVKGDITDNQLVATFNRITKAYENIEEKIFDKNEDSCYNYGRQCDYFQYCHYGKKGKHLVKLGAKNGKDKNKS